VLGDKSSAIGLAEEIEYVFSGFGNAVDLMRAFDAAELLVPATGVAELSALTGAAGIRWVTAFTCVSELRGFAAVRPELRADVVIKTFPGAVLRAAVAALAGPVGVVVDIAGPRPMLFPPVPEGV
jgi:hypothetical protein